MKGRILKQILAVVVFVGACGLITFFVLKSVPSTSKNANVETLTEEKAALVWKNHQQGNKEEAIRLGERYLKLNPKDAEVLIVVAENYMWKGKLSLAEVRAKEALKLSPDSAWGLRVLAEIYRLRAGEAESLKKKDGYLTLAKTQIEKALDIAPDDYWVNSQAAHIYLDLNEKAKAGTFTDKALKLKSKN